VARPDSEIDLAQRSTPAGGRPQAAAAAAQCCDVVRTSEIPVGELLTIRLADGPDDQAVAGP